MTAVTPDWRTAGAGGPDKPDMDWKRGFHRLAFLLLSSVIVVVGSERMFWYWTPDLAVQPELALFYAIPTAGFLWALDHYRVSGWWSLIAAAPLFAYITEGVLTPVLYSGGPMVPFFPLWFAGWHGLLSVVVLWYAIRRYLIADRRKHLLALSAGLGVFWGAWSMTSLLPGNLTDPEMVAELGEAPTILGPADFAVYAATFTAVLAAAHWLLGRGLWVTGFKPAAATRIIYGTLVGAMVIGWTLAFPWAVPMLAAYVALQLWILRKHRTVATEPSLLAQLDGRVELRSLWPLAAMPVLAAATYTALWAFEPSEAALTGILVSVIGAQILVALVLWVRAFLKIRRAASSHADPAPAWGIEPLARIESAPTWEAF